MGGYPSHISQAIYQMTRDEVYYYLGMTLLIIFFQPYSEKMKKTTDEDKKNMYLRIIVSITFYLEVW